MCHDCDIFEVFSGNDLLADNKWVYSREKIRAALFCLMAWAFNHLRKQQSSSFCRAGIKNPGVFYFCSTAVKMVLSMFIQQIVNWRCTH